MLLKRARGHRLYTEANKKILDLSMDYGRAVLGHRPNGLSLALKNSIERGIYASYGSKFHTRLENYLKGMFPDHPNITFLSSIKIIESSKTILDPLVDPANGEYGYWRPFLKSPDYNNIILLYPLPGINSVVVMVSKGTPEFESEDVSPVLVSGILRSMYDYDRALLKFKENSYNRFKDLPNSVLIPPYLVSTLNEKSYRELCCKAMDQGVLLNSKSQINILPNDYSDGEVKKLLKVLGDSSV